MLLFFLFKMLFAPLHPIHVSVSDVDITTADITWTARIYKDDLLRALYGDKIDMSLFDDEEKIRKDILLYFSRNVIVTANQDKLKWTLKDIQSDPEAIWITASAPINTAASLVIQNRILLDVYNDQKNVVNFTWNTGKKNLVFEKGDEKKVISL
jgi:hypothetical protein